LSEPKVELIACETCGGSAEREAHGTTRGERLIAELTRVHEEAPSAVTLTRVRCLWACSRSCAVHVRAPGRPGYVLCGFEPTEESARGLLAWAAQYAASSDGAVPFKQWPAAVRGHFLCRIPATPIAEGDSDLPPDASC
jgi:predicted metal-binding protein